MSAVRHGWDVLSSARRVSEDSRRLRAAAGLTRQASKAVRAEAHRATARSERVVRAGTYARVAGVRNGSLTHVVVRRDGTVCGAQTEAGENVDPIRATLAVVRGLDRVSAVSVRMAGLRPGIPNVRASARLPDDAGDRSAGSRRFGDEIADRLRVSVIRPLFAIGLRATSLRKRTTDPTARRELDEIIGSLDLAITELRATVMGPVLEANRRVVRDLAAIRTTAASLQRSAEDPHVQEQLRCIVEWLASVIDDVRSPIFKLTGPAIGHPAAAPKSDPQGSDPTPAA